MVMRSPFPDLEIPDMPLTDFVLARAGELGEKPALIDAPAGRAITYAQLVESVRAVAAGLAERGFRKGEVFAHYAPNLPEYAVAFHAVATIGGVNTTANPQLTAEELSTQLKDAGARLLVTVPELVENAVTAARQAGVEGIFVYGDADGVEPFDSLRAADEPPEVAIDPANDLVALPYWSGTAGLPKGVMLTHRNLVANVCQDTFERPREQWADDRVIAVLPFFHSYGLVWLLNLPTYCGATVVTIDLALKQFAEIKPDLSLELRIQSLRLSFDLLVELDLTSRPSYNRGKLLAYDAFLCGWSLAHPRYETQETRPAVVFVCADAHALLTLAREADEAMTGRIGVMGTGPEQWYHAGRDHVFFAVEADIHHGDVTALALPSRPPGLRERLTNTRHLDLERVALLPEKLVKAKRNRG